jgi:DNA (cytosine-5)-methyltransferase 1
LELGLKLALGHQYRTVCYVEREAYAAATLVARMEDEALDRAPIWDDLESFDAGRWRGAVDLVSAGWPCQTYSTAARGRNTHPDLWGQVRRVIQGVEPEYVFLENVSGNEDIWMGVRQNLCRDGFHVVGPILARASDVGAPHERPRRFLLAHTHDAQQFSLAVDDEMARPSCSSVPWHPWGKPLDVERVDDGTTGRMERSRAIGEGVVPLVAAYAFCGLAFCAGLVT